MNRSKRIACLVGALLAIVVALAAPAAFAGCGGNCGGGQVFSAPVYAAPQIFAAPVYQPAAVFAAPQVVYQQRAYVQAAPVYQQAAIVQKNVVVARAQRQPLFGFRSSRSVNVHRNVVRGNAAAAVVY